MVNFLVNKPSVELAEFIGIMLGDGNLNRYNYQIRVCGHNINSRQYFFNYIMPLANKLFDIKFNVYERPRYHQIYLVKSNKNLFYTLIKFGLVPGNKKLNNVTIPKWIFRDKKYLKACIRGLVDTDGTVCPITGRNYSYIWFKSGIPNLRNSFSKAMEILGYKTAKWSGNLTPQTYIGKKELIRKYYKEIKFKNPYHIKRFMMPL
jgi:hypothetical protein